MIRYQDKSNIREKAFIPAGHSGVQPCMAGIEENWCHPYWKDLPTSVNIIKVTTHSQPQMRV